MTHPVLSRILMLDHVADERFREHQRRSTSAAAIVGVLTLFGKGFGHQHPAIFDGLRFLLMGLAISLLFWSVRHRKGCIPRS